MTDERMAKTAEEIQEQKETPKNNTIADTVGSRLILEGVPITYYRYFDIPFGQADTKDEYYMRRLHELIGQDGDKLGEMARLMRLEQELGAATLGGRERLRKVYNWLQLKKSVGGR